MGMRWRHLRVPLTWGRMSVQIGGDGPPLLLLHGLGGSGRYWAGALPVLGGRRTVIAPDIAGFGRSDKPDADYSGDFHVRAVEELLATLDVHGPLDLAGHSMGGILAALYALRHAARVSTLALVASPFPRAGGLAHRMPSGRSAATLYRTAQALLPLASPLIRSSTFPRAVIADYLRHTVTSYQRTSDALIWNPALAAELRPLGTLLAGRPQLLLYSEEDRTIGPDNLPRWRAVLPAAEVRVMPGAHQLLLRDHFATLAAWYPTVAAPHATPAGIGAAPGASPGAARWS